jgi:hypothetical protein
MEGGWKNYGHFCKSTTVLYNITLQIPKGIMYVYFEILINKNC